MQARALHCGQTKIPSRGNLGLSAMTGIPSPYYTNIADGILFPRTKIMIAIVTSYQGSGNNLRVGVMFKQADDSGLGPVTVDIPLSSITDVPSIISQIDGKVAQFVTDNSLETLSGVLHPLDYGALANIPGAHIGDAATNAPTNLNVLTTLLGTLTGEVNATNAKQNDLATKFNTLLDRLEAAGILATV